MQRFLRRYIWYIQSEELDIDDIEIDFGKLQENMVTFQTFTDYIYNYKKRNNENSNTSIEKTTEKEEIILSSPRLENIDEVSLEESDNEENSLRLRKKDVVTEAEVEVEESVVRKVKTVQMYDDFNKVLTKQSLIDDAIMTKKEIDIRGSFFNDWTEKITTQVFGRTIFHMSASSTLHIGITILLIMLEKNYGRISMFTCLCIITVVFFFSCMKYAEKVQVEIEKAILEQQYYVLTLNKIHFVGIMIYDEDRILRVFLDETLFVKAFIENHTDDEKFVKYQLIKSHPTLVIYFNSIFHQYVKCLIEKKIRESTILDYGYLQIGELDFDRIPKLDLSNVGNRTEFTHFIPWITIKSCLFLLS
ncbi:hypothetical protein SNEBB_010501 [Seison nebaliae]|nr:hypothetical protein SNEBB_010501 [Seison nebaliae]